MKQRFPFIEKLKRKGGKWVTWESVQPQLVMDEKDEFQYGEEEEEIEEAEIEEAEFEEVEQELAVEEIIYNSREIDYNEEEADIFGKRRLDDYGVDNRLERKYESQYSRDYENQYNNKYEDQYSINYHSNYENALLEPEPESSDNEGIFKGFSFNHHNGNNFRSESSLSAFSTPEPMFGKLSKEKGGRVGLRNLGNTCYLNSTLQCLTAVEELSYRLAEEYENGNLSGGGDLMFLRVLGRLFHEMWQSEGKSSSIGRQVDPSQFKSILGHIDSRFSGYRQEDSQEALSIILDRLHEDLKTATRETRDSEIRESGTHAVNESGALETSVNEFVSPETSTLKTSDPDGWLLYSKKENSIVKELFHGQLKSSLQCCKCSFKSEIYEPFCFLNLPIPTGKKNYNESEVLNRKSEGIYDMPNINLSTTTANDSVSNVSSSASKAFNICCYNDRLTAFALNPENSYLIMKRTFSNVNEFKSSFRGGGFWIVLFEPDAGIVSISTKLPERSDLIDQNKIYIAYRADLLSNNYLITFTFGPDNVRIGFPILVKNNLYEELTSALLIENFFKRTIRPILRSRFPGRLEEFDESIRKMQLNPNEFFKLEPIEEFGDLKRVQAVILNNLIFSSGSSEDEDEMNELFEELCKDESEMIEEEEEQDSVKDRVGDLSEYSAYSGYTSGYSGYGVHSGYNGYTNGYSNGYTPDTISTLGTLSTTGTSGSNTSTGSSHSSSSIHPTLMDCFNRLCSKETLNEWKCERCQIPVQAEKRLQLWRLPDILICHLKRFSFSGFSGYGGYFNYGGAKISTAVDFDFEIDLKELVAEEGDSPYIPATRYELFAISQHFGSLHYGHYTAVLRHQATNRWFLADDSCITIYDENDNSWFDTKLKEAAYVLFYRRIK